MQKLVSGSKVPTIRRRLSPLKMLMHGIIEIVVDEVIGKYTFTWIVKVLGYGAVGQIEISLSALVYDIISNIVRKLERKLVRYCSAFFLL